MLCQVGSICSSPYEVKESVEGTFRRKYLSEDDICWSKIFFGLENQQMPGNAILMFRNRNFLKQDFSK